MRNIYIIALAILALMAGSCAEDILDKKPLDKFSELDVWTDGALSEGFVLTIYSGVVNNLYVNQFTEDWTDDVVCNEDNGERSIQAGTFENTADFGWNQYSNIRNCNLAITKIGESTSIDANVKTRLIAEAKMLRAMTYFWMVRRFGGVMLVDKVLTPEDEMKLPRATEKGTYEFIFADVEAAIADLPETAEKGRLTKGAAYAFMTMAALQANDYDRVIAAADAVETMGFELDPVYKNLFNSFTGTTTSKEVIFLYYADKEHMVFGDTRMFRYLCNCYNGIKLNEDAVPQYDPQDEFNAWPLRWPSQELVDAYLIKENGTAVQKTWQEFQGKPSRLMWQDRDDRFEQTIVHDSAVYSRSIFTFRQGGNAHWTSNPLSTWGMSKSGYMFRKWLYENEYIFVDYPVSWAEPILRLGEVYLNKAEAYARKGNYAKAIEYMNKTRTTHGGLPALSTGSSNSDFWKYYKLERRVELTQEDDRYWSLIRWARTDNASSIPELDGYKLHGLDMKFDGITNVVESPFTVTMKFEVPKRLLFPVPDGQIRENNNLTQNPGWD
jgi:tetratricopeptide (TPR) repeat protein